MTSQSINAESNIDLSTEENTNVIIPLDFPERVTLELTNFCNLRCQMCPRNYMNYPQGFMDSSLFMNIVDEMSYNGSRILVPFFRGESVLHKDFIELLNYAKKKQLTIQLATNGTLLTEDIAKALIGMNLDFISFSVDNISPDEYSKLRQGSDFSRLMNGLNLVLKEKDKQNSKSPVIQISAVDLGMTDAVKNKFVAFWKNLVQRIRIYPQHSSNGHFGNLSTNQNDFLERLPCHKPFKEMIIYWDGRSASCNHDWNRHEGLGDVMRDGGLLGVWNGKDYCKLRDEQIKLEFNENSVCLNCDHWAQYYNHHNIIGEVYYNG